MDTKNIISQFLPIFLLFFFLTHTTRFVSISTTILGKLFAIVTILFYLRIDYIYGLLVCVFVIFYYQTDFVTETSLNIQEGMTDYSSDSDSDEGEDEEDDDKKKKATIAKSPTLLIGEDLEDAYPIDPSKKKISEDENAKSEFRKMHCENGHLIKKGLLVNPNIAEHVFADLDTGCKTCNICSNSCDFRVINNRLISEEEIMKPKDSNDYFTNVLKNIMK